MVNILYEDNHVIVAVKPPNMLSQADQTKDADILTELKEYIRIKYRKPGNVYLGLVHRLDRPVGGLMVFARTSKAASRLSAQMREHDMGREYLCVTQGQAKEKFTLINYLIENERMNRVVVCDADERGAQEAILHGRRLAVHKNTALCALRLETGRKHQIRVQMKEMGAPLWGDHRYGKAMPGQQIALWGYRLTFEHPTTHNIMTFQNLPCGSIWNTYADELTDLANEFANSAAAILQEKPAPAEAPVEAVEQAGPAEPVTPAVPIAPVTPVVPEFVAAPVAPVAPEFVAVPEPILAPEPLAEPVSQPVSDLPDAYAAAWRTMENTAPMPKFTPFTLANPLFEDSDGGNQ